MRIKVFYTYCRRRPGVEIQRKTHIPFAFQVFMPALFHVNPLLANVIVSGGIQAHVCQRSRSRAIHIQGSPFPVGFIIIFSEMTQEPISCTVFKTHTVFSFFLVFLIFENLGFSALRGEPLNPMFSLSLGRSTACAYAYPLDTMENK